VEFLGLRTVIYPAPDLAAAKAAYSAVLGQEPYFDQPFYVGFNVAGYELGLDPGGDVAVGPIAYWGVGSVTDAYATLLASGMTEHTQVQDVGDGIRVATLRDAGGNVFGIIENPHFKLPTSGDSSAGT
jgi:catechol 2,3-dioxygenase-like lactoylglutathione lyase family enzyme